MKKTLSVLAAFGFVLGMGSMAMAASPATGTMATSATLENACTVSAATMDFPAFPALGSTADQAAVTTDLSIACTNGSSPMIWSDTIRNLNNATFGDIAFSLGQVAGSNDLSLDSVGADAITGLIKDGTPKAVTLHGTIATAAFTGMEAGEYTADITVKVNY